MYNVILTTLTQDRTIHVRVVTHADTIPNALKAAHGHALVRLSFSAFTEEFPLTVRDEATESVRSLVVHGKPTLTEDRVVKFGKLPINNEAFYTITKAATHAHD